MVRAVLVSKGICGEQDLVDPIGEVVLACVEHVRATSRPPADVAGAIGMARPIARADAIDAARKRARRGKRNRGPTAEADQHALEPQPSIDPVDEERMLATIRQVLNDDQIAALAEVGAGVAQTELATESRTSPPAIRKRVQKSREKALGALGTRGYLVAGGFAALLAGTIAVVVGSSLGDREAVRASPGEVAAEQRRLAAGARRDGKGEEGAGPRGAGGSRGRSGGRGGGAAGGGRGGAAAMGAGDAGGGGRRRDGG